MTNITTIIEQHRPELASYETLYKQLHANPELSFQEHETARTIVRYLSKLAAFKVHAEIGGSTGVAAVFDNNDGGTVEEGKTKTILLRADMDALPVEEKTGLAYASSKKMVDLEGVEKSVMHACG